ncbi:hypothetical protein GHO42_05975 [Pseudomonas sp. FSL R10-0056]|uniref:hypothetical protein n=1 Tax=unclassified Pseudomonas TaxID=196821 RepID=UPI0012977D61|nr:MULTISPECIES: hypothetical protein [unclassified Pseudomonas]MQT62652.1 hypothetical protein [Pseudomonas sp. FSL R10-0056]MQT66575.1 hypothetical protein [Pseudomonas sp. FSL R10-0071]MQU49378.1 hypothetical protein [Pseudomonas sp. FSL A6-1183]
MLEPLQGATNQFFDDLCRLVDPREDLPLLRPQVEAYRWEALHHAGMVNIYHQMQGFLCGLMVSEVLDIEQGRHLNQRLENCHDGGWR